MNEIKLSLLVDQILYYRHNDDKPKTIITKEVFEIAQETAKDLLRGVAYVDPELEYHWESIAIGQVPEGYIIEG